MAAASRSFLNGFLAGLATGLVLSLAVALWVGRNNPFVESPPSTEAAAEGDAAPAAAPSYDFYKGSPAPEPGAAPEPAAPPSAAAEYFLQAGAFLNAGDAEALRAKLALLGLEAIVQRVADAQAIELHKVRLGPFSGMDELNQIRERLSQNGIDSLLIKPDSQHPSKEKP
jgi:cell division protein FtsN